ncbi:hypothetical protein [Thermosulfurimonas sp. F29]|uniref:hypothetical protein n=1 Tax=Thermosulfurimonas sp. F29 TaxID=2867247 RepID=UPI001C839FDB|nr:hypothetical protein [Thermosulfurimonas sp. F29]MBX6423509.1 hypothetical protein [Thermosulfurimonas sp. F29]
MEKIELTCEGCGRKYRLRRPPEEIKEDLLFCPQCGGKLVFPRREEEGSGVLEDFLLTGPVALIYWDLPADFSPVERVLSEKGFALRRFTTLAELRSWLRIFIPELLVYGTEEADQVQAFEELLTSDLPMQDYRRIFRAWITSRYKTLEPREVFYSGMHMICQPDHLGRFEEIYGKARRYWEALYQPYYQALKEESAA